MIFGMRRGGKRVCCMREEETEGRAGNRERKQSSIKNIQNRNNSIGASAQIFIPYGDVWDVLLPLIHHPNERL